MNHKQVFDKFSLISNLKKNGVWFNLIDGTKEFNTVKDVVEIGIPEEKIVKSLVFITDKDPVLVIVLGSCLVDKEKLKGFLNSKNIRLANDKEVEEYSGYPIGAVPPVFHKNIKKVIIDEMVMEKESVVGGGGSLTSLIELKTKDLQKLNKAIVAKISVEKR